MNPAYDVDGITIYHADCADVLPTINRLGQTALDLNQ